MNLEIFLIYWGKKKSLNLTSPVPTETSVPTAVQPVSYQQSEDACFLVYLQIGFLYHW